MTILMKFLSLEACSFVHGGVESDGFMLCLSEHKFMRGQFLSYLPRILGTN